MALDKVIDSAWLEAGLKKVCDGIRSKTGGSANLAFPDEMDAQIRAIDTQEDLSPELAEQDTLLAELAVIVNEKAAPSKIETVEVTIGPCDRNTVYYSSPDGRDDDVWSYSKLDAPDGTYTINCLRNSIIIVCDNYATSASTLEYLSSGVGGVFEFEGVTKTNKVRMIMASVSGEIIPYPY